MYTNEIDFYTFQVLNCNKYTSVGHLVYNSKTVIADYFQVFIL